MQSEHSEFAMSGEMDHEEQISVVYHVPHDVEKIFSWCDRT